MAISNYKNRQFHTPSCRRQYGVLRALDARDYLVDSFERRLAERVDVARVVRFLMPLVRREECAV
jgi:hypothetical protein